MEIDATAIAVYSDMEPAGVFTCSDDRVNRLVENTRWSMKSNFLDLPTDCPAGRLMALAASDGNDGQPAGRELPGRRERNRVAGLRCGEGQH